MHSFQSKTRSAIATTLADSRARQGSRQAAANGPGLARLPAKSEQLSAAWPGRRLADIPGPGAMRPRPQDQVVYNYRYFLPHPPQWGSLAHGQAVLLDGGAAEVLQARGFGGWLGVHVGRPADYGIMSEQYEAGLLPGVDGCRVPHRGRKWHPVRTTGATVASRFADAKNRWHIGSTVFENSLGGRVAVYASVGAFSDGTFGCHARRRWLHGVLRWLSRGRFGVLPVIPQHGLTVVRSRGERRLVAFANLGTDVLTHLQLRLGDGTVTRKIYWLEPQGRWTPAEVEIADRRVRVDCRLNAFNWLVLLLE